MEDKKNKASGKENQGVENRKKVNRELLPKTKRVARKRKADECSKADSDIDPPVLPSQSQRISKTGRLIKCVKRTDL